MKKETLDTANGLFRKAERTLSYIEALKEAISLNEEGTMSEIRFSYSIARSDEHKFVTIKSYADEVLGRLSRAMLKELELIKDENLKAIEEL